MNCLTLFLFLSIFLTPVSYTHLDVYKRQGCGSASAPPWALRPWRPPPRPAPSYDAAQIADVTEACSIAACFSWPQFNLCFSFESKMTRQIILNHSVETKSAYRCIFLPFIYTYVCTDISFFKINYYCPVLLVNIFIYDI